LLEVAAAVYKSAHPDFFTTGEELAGFKQAAGPRDSGGMSMDQFLASQVPSEWNQPGSMTDKSAKKGGKRARRGPGGSTKKSEKSRLAPSGDNDGTQGGTEDGATISGA
jgi:hypothetical protein